MIAGIGTDIVEVSRMDGALARFGERFARRILTPAEFERFRRSPNPSGYLAKRFAAKEAALKALGTGLAAGLRWHDIETDNNQQGAPLLRFSGRAADLQQERGIRKLHLSLSDERAHVVAFVILEH
ncbi:holo-ACP synthase [Motiliproteus sp. SC1-56]|uniref:holo-ACP synthase n=1 Tax=Motiliproteus sp. SC1-56 TaxID=2799565 RepID=UPI001A8D45D5